MRLRFSMHGKAAMLVSMILVVGNHVQGEDQDVLLSRALKISGMSSQIKALDQTLFSSLPADAFSDSKTRNRAEKVLTKAADQEALLALVHDSVKQDFDGESLEKVLEFYNSRLGQKVGRLHGTALAPSLLRNIREGRKAVASLDEARLTILRRIIRSQRLIESNTELLRSVVWGLLEGFSAASGNPSESTTEIDLTAIVRAVAFPRNRTEDIAMLALANTYQSLSDKELEELASYQESGAAARFQAAVHNGIKTALYQTAKTLGKSINNVGEPTP
ncbi:MAG: hypothetical protein NTW27_09680 [Deltaproteobacteria bacterium]|jgi:hypothetical protein|nr:hypothetical protein [Deltaproteobacteria bacterium]